MTRCYEIYDFLSRALLSLRLLLAKLLAVSPATVRRLIDAGKLKAVKCFYSIRVDRRDVYRYIEEAKG